MSQIDMPSLFDSLVASVTPVNLPALGTTYLFKWDDDTHADDWRADGYRWRQGGSKNIKCSNN